MKIREIGRMIYTLRTEKEISQEDLCRGICSVATLCRLESGERRPDILIFNALCQRLGKTMDNIGITLTLEEFEYVVEQRNIEISLSLKEYERGERELQEQERRVGDHPLKRQELHRQYAMLYLQWKQDEQKVKEHILEAVTSTIPDFRETARRDFTVFASDFRKKLMTRLWLSETETGLLLLYGYLREKEGEESRDLLECIREYIQWKVTDSESQNRQMAQVMYLLAKNSGKRGRWQECLEFCETVIAAEGKTGSPGLMERALALELCCLDHGAFCKHQNLRKKQYQVLQSVLQEYGGEMAEETSLFLFRSSFQEKQMVDELLHYARIRKELSQETLSEGICAPETLSRIETGKRNPTVKHFYGLMQKLGLELGYYNTYFDVERFETLEKGRQLQRLLVLGEFRQAEEKLREIETEIDRTKVRNMQYLTFNHAVLERELYHGNPEELAYRIEQALELTLDRKEERFRIYYQPTQIEISLLNQQAVLYRLMGNQQESVKILESLYEYYHRGKLKGVERDKKYIMILSNLASSTEEINELEQALEYTNEAITQGIKIRKGIKLGGNLITKAYIQERKEEKICLTTYEQAYYMCGLFEDFRNQKTVRDYVKMNWGVDFNTYHQWDDGCPMA